MEVKIKVSDLPECVANELGGKKVSVTAEFANDAVSVENFIQMIAASITGAAQDLVRGIAEHGTFERQEPPADSDESDRAAYIGVKTVEAYPQEQDGEPGYVVIYPGGYRSWSPADVFEKHYFRLDSSDGVSAVDVEHMQCLSDMHTVPVGVAPNEAHSLSLRVALPSGFIFFATASCDGYSLVPDTFVRHLCQWRMRDAMLDALRFVYLWGRNGMRIQASTGETEKEIGNGK